jgi:hypothetical protein
MAQGKIIGYTAQNRLKQGGRVVHSDAKTFDRRQAARASPYGAILSGFQ